MLLHEGYVDGIEGRDPNPDLEESEEYSDGWLLGVEDRVNGRGLVPMKTAIKEGDQVRVIRGTRIETGVGSRVAQKTYTVKVSHVEPGLTARYTPRGTPCRPVAPRVYWDRQFQSVEAYLVEAV